jgi:class 3 adenylate cyclase
VFDAILEKAHSLCGAAHGVLVVREGETWRAVGARGLPEEFAARLRSGFPVAGNPVAEPLLAGAPFVQLADLSRVDHPVTQAAVAAGLRTLVAVALRRDGALLGWIVAARTEVRIFSNKDIALLQNFAAQAVIAMENARLITETREALEQQTATAEVSGVINSSPGDLPPVFDALLEKALRLCGATFGIFYAYDGEFFHMTASRHVPLELADFMREPFRVGRGAGTRRLADGERTVHIVDITAEKPSPGLQATAELGGARTLLFVALRKEDALLGFISIYRQEVRPFTEKQIALLQNFAAQAVIAMENARLITETREALDQQTATSEVLQVINASPGDLAPVFDAMLERAIRLCGAQFGQLVTTADGQVFTVAAAQGPTAVVEFLRNRPPTRPGRGTSMHRLVQGERRVHIPDVTSDEAYQGGDTTRRALVDLGGCRTFVTVGLRKEDALLGAITVYRQEMRPFSDKEIALLENFAAQTVIAMENARLLGELRQRTDEVGELNRGLEARVAEQVDELGRVGRLKRFLAPQLAEMIVSQGDEKILESHRREIVVVFCDLRGYTAFTETAEPEEVLNFLREYHGALGPLVSQFEGTLDQFSGDGIMVFFNDPVPIPDPAERAVKMAMAMREVANELIASWRRRRGRVLGFGVGIAQGYATLGQIGFAERSGYTAIGTVCNLAARLCAEAKDGQILVAQSVAVAVEDTTPLEEVGELNLKGLTQPVSAYNVPHTASQLTLRVIEGRPQST